MMARTRSDDGYGIVWVVLLIFTVASFVLFLHTEILVTMQSEAHRSTRESSRLLAIGAMNETADHLATDWPVTGSAQPDCDKGTTNALCPSGAAMEDPTRYSGTDRPGRMTWRTEVSDNTTATYDRAAVAWDANTDGKLWVRSSATRTVGRPRVVAPMTFVALVERSAGTAPITMGTAAVAAKTVTMPPGGAAATGSAPRYVRGPIRYRTTLTNPPTASTFVPTGFSTVTPIMGGSANSLTTEQVDALKVAAGTALTTCPTALLTAPVIYLTASATECVLPGTAASKVTVVVTDRPVRVAASSTLVGAIYSTGPNVRVTGNSQHIKGSVFVGDSGTGAHSFSVITNNAPVGTPYVDYQLTTVEVAGAAGAEVTIGQKFRMSGPAGDL